MELEWRMRGEISPPSKNTDRMCSESGPFGQEWRATDSRWGTRHVDYSFGVERTVVSCCVGVWSASLSARNAFDISPHVFFGTLQGRCNMTESVGDSFASSLSRTRSGQGTMVPTSLRTSKKYISIMQGLGEDGDDREQTLP